MNGRTSQPAEIAISNFGPEDRRRVSAWFDHLKNWENEATVLSVRAETPLSMPLDE